MAKATLNEQNKEFTSALLDNEVNLTDESMKDVDQGAFARYSLIGDVMRSEATSGISLNIADSVASQLENEPVHADFSAKQNDKKADTSKGKVVSMKWWRTISQTAIAASVAVVAVIGVQQYTGQGSEQSELPQLQSQPFLGSASPVSYSSEPALQNAEQGLRELQQKRIGALVVEHQRQTREAARLAANEQAQTKEQ